MPFALVSMGVSVIGAKLSVVLTIGISSGSFLVLKEAFVVAVLVMFAAEEKFDIGELIGVSPFGLVFSDLREFLIALDIL